LVQKEVAQKICAGENDQSILSLNVQIFGKPEIIATVGPANFFPAPKVDSAILKIEVYEKPLITNLKLFSQISRIAFAQRRKTLGNTIKNFTRANREETEKLLKSINIDPSRRPQTLSIAEWEKLINRLP
ncbi:16S rRNA (adenine(1518)-N(6)/adenine(1519)-N(6))-dimethyltransferase, partial [Patescibacteria group bacterium]|nr:16S rRNA (adenine(1518)-N(6)/adenine(1519)-N(6))-dimethyltransferase [Patescibacteria group bacterium]